jgi:hypothetical protein
MAAAPGDCGIDSLLDRLALASGAMNSATTALASSPPLFRRPKPQALGPYLEGVAEYLGDVGDAHSGRNDASLARLCH